MWILKLRERKGGGDLVAMEENLVAKKRLQKSERESLVHADHLSAHPEEGHDKI